MKKVLTAFTLLVFSTTLYSCFTNPVTGRKSLNVLPESEMRGMAKQEYQSLLGSTNVVQNSQNAEMVQRVGERMQVAVSKYLQSIGKQDLINGYQWEFNLVNDNQVNAWCMPGGKVVFYSGIMPYCQDEAGVAVVMGHEIAHAVARHGNERMSQQLTAQLGTAVLSEAMSEKPEQTRQLFNTAVGAGSQLGLLAYSRKHESEADEMGLYFMAYAGYDPNAAVAFWQRMAAAGGQKPPEFLSTHPSNSRRIRDIQNTIPKAMQYYKPN